MLRAKLGAPPSRKADSRAQRRGLSLHPALHFGGGRYLVSHFRAEWRPQRAPEIKSKETIRTCLLGASWGLLGASRAVLGPSWAVLEASWGRLGPVLGPSWAVLGASWAVLGPSWAVLEPSWGPLEPFWTL